MAAEAEGLEGKRGMQGRKKGKGVVFKGRGWRERKVCSWLSHSGEGKEAGGRRRKLEAARAWISHRAKGLNQNR